MDIASWLRELGLECYEQAFQDNDIDLIILPELTAQDLAELGISSIGHRRKLLLAIAMLGKGDDFEQEPVRAGSSATPDASNSERRQLTVMFVDLVGSTALSRKLDPEDMREVFTAYQNTVAGVVTRFEGYVAKYMGDGALAYFGWPRAHEDEAERAVRAGLALIEDIPKLATPAGQPLAARVGIATGLVVVGDLFGESASETQAVVGNPPNLAARLQALAGPDRVVVSAATRRLLGTGFDLNDLGPQAVKGLAEPVEAFRVIGERAALSRFDARAGTTPAPMVGRDQELALLLQRWEQAKAGEGQGVQLIGEAGIGKSRVVRAVLDEVAREPHFRVRYQCSPYYRDSALWPVGQQLQRAAGFAEGESNEVKLDRLEALLAKAGDERAGTADRRTLGPGHRSLWQAGFEPASQTRPDPGSAVGAGHRSCQQPAVAARTRRCPLDRSDDT